MQQNDQGLQYRVAESSQILSVVHERNDPRISLRNDEVVHVEQYGDLVHWEVVAYRPIDKFTIH